MDISRLYCPACGKHEFYFQGDNHWICASCHLTVFRNVVAAAGAFIRVGNEFLALVRSKDPGKGKLALPGGFIDFGETLEEGLRREIWEEVGLRVDKLDYLCGTPNRYEYKNILYHTMDIYFTVDLPSKPDLILEPDEVAGIKWLKIDDFNLSDFAFEATQQAAKIFSSRAREENR